MLLSNLFAALQVYPSNSGDDYSRDPAGYTPSKPPSTVYPGAFYMAGELLTTPVSCKLDRAGAARPVTDDRKSCTVCEMEGVWGRSA